jgi:protein-tyrosine phosphatase
MAEWVLREQARRLGLEDVVTVDSAGTGSWHAGEAADPRAVAALRRHGYVCDGHAARQFQRWWFGERELIVALDRGHLLALREMAPDPETASRVRLLRSFDPEANGELDVPDPYYGGNKGFDRCLDLIEPATAGLLEEIGDLLRR